MNQPNYEKPLPPGFNQDETDRRQSYFRRAVTWYLCSYLIYLLSWAFLEPGAGFYARLLGIAAYIAAFNVSLLYWTYKHKDKIDALRKRKQP